MKKYTFATLGSWATKVDKRHDLIVKQAAQDTIERASRTLPGKNRGGSVTPGFVPRDLGFLAGSLQSALNGTTALTGEDSYVAIILGMEAGDTVEFGWTAEYARAQHYKGWLWRDKAVTNWQGTVNRAVARAKAILR